MINFTRAFDLAWERMMVILFRPFDLGKWCVIAFSAFLAGLLSGGNSFNTSFRNNFKGTSSTSGNLSVQQLQTGVSHFFSSMQAGLVILLVAGVFAFVAAFILLILWLGARGQFLLLDNIVRNRPAIAAPWKAYARLGNEVFVLYLVLFAISFAILLVLLVPAVLLCLPLFEHGAWPVGTALFGLIALGVVYLAVTLVLDCVMFIFREWGVALMFRNGIGAKAAFMETLALVRRHPGPTALFILLRFALWIGLVVLSLVTCCLSCSCLAIIPYVGTVVLLPALIYIRCFSLDCLAQFGPACDAWTVDVPTGAAQPAPLSPPPPPG